MDEIELIDGIDEDEVRCWCIYCTAVNINGLKETNDWSL